MHDVLKANKQNSSQKFCKSLFNFEKPQVFQQTPKVRSQKMKCMKKWMRKSLTREKKLSWDRRTLGEEVWSDLEEFGRWKDWKDQERSWENEAKIVVWIFGWAACLIAFIFVFFSSWKTVFKQSRQLLDTSRQLGYLSSSLASFYCNLDSSSIAPRSIKKVSVSSINAR